jgi:hypothetical protein
VETLVVTLAVETLVVTLAVEILAVTPAVEILAVTPAVETQVVTPVAAILAVETRLNGPLPSCNPSQTKTLMPFLGKTPQ